MASSYELVNELIEAEIKSGIPIERIVVGKEKMRFIRSNKSTTLPFKAAFQWAER